MAKPQNIVPPVIETEKMFPNKPPLNEEIINEPQPLEKQEAIHAQSIEVSKPVLEPGRPIEVESHLLGQLEGNLKVAQANGQHGIAADIQSLIIKIGGLLNHLHQTEEKIDDEMKKVYEKIYNFFKK